jgi:hypothetical protein
MKAASVVLCGLILTLAIVANAQEISGNLPSSPASAADAGTVSDAPRLFASATLVPAPEFPALGVPLPDASPAPQAAVQGVFPNYSFQAYAGYTFVRLYALPSEEVNRNGFDLSMSYFPKAGHFAAEGALTTTFGSIRNEQSDFVFFGGGPRFRWDGSRGIEIWAHGLIGDANFEPRLAGFDQNALGFEAGGGVDINAHLQHFSYRAEVDMVGTRLYNTTQYSPKFSVGIVYKF